MKYLPENEMEKIKKIKEEIDSELTKLTQTGVMND
jgi:hypothetical protein